MTVAEVEKIANEFILSTAFCKRYQLSLGDTRRQELTACTVTQAHSYDGDGGGAAPEQDTPCPEWAAAARTPPSPTNSSDYDREAASSSSRDDCAARTRAAYNALLVEQQRALRTLTTATLEGQVQYWRMPYMTTRKEVEEPTTSKAPETQPLSQPTIF